jgi:tetratricopeptide (TPR) repeat protein
MVRREGNMAVVDYKQLLKFPNAQPPFGEAASREQRVMLKKNGKWLVASATTTDITAFGENGTELSLNATGYNYLYAGKNDEAIKVLELNTVLFPNSFNVWDSLGEAYLKAGNKEKAKENYEKSMALNPNNESGKKALAELK